MQLCRRILYWLAAYWTYPLHRLFLYLYSVMDVLYGFCIIELVAVFTQCTNCLFLPSVQFRLASCCSYTLWSLLFLLSVQLCMWALYCVSFACFCSCCSYPNVCGFCYFVLLLLLFLFLIFCSVCGFCMLLFFGLFLLLPSVSVWLLCLFGGLFWPLFLLPSVCLWLLYVF